GSLNGGIPCNICGGTGWVGNTLCGACQGLGTCTTCGSLGNTNSGCTTCGGFGIWQIGGGTNTTDSGWGKLGLSSNGTCATCGNNSSAQWMTSSSSDPIGTAMMPLTFVTDYV